MKVAAPSAAPAAAAAAITAVVALVGGVVGFGMLSSPPPSGATPVATTRPAHAVAQDMSHRLGLGGAPADPLCRSTRGPFTPTVVSAPGVIASTPALALPRDPMNVPGVPPRTNVGKRLFGWDAGGARPGASEGNVNLDAHTWPDGTALGNTLLRRLRAGGVLALKGAGGHVQCYRVVDELEVPIDAVPRKVLDRVYATSGPARLTIIVCSGTRLGPGKWTHRTLWYADAVTRA
jgi:hypothetical protein